MQGRRWRLPCHSRPGRDAVKPEEQNSPYAVSYTHLHLIGVVIDRFGKDVFVRKADEKHFQISVEVAVSNQFFGWLFGLGRGARIIEPSSVVEKMEKLLDKVREKYEGAESSMEEAERR